MMNCHNPSTLLFYYALFLYLGALHLCIRINYHDKVQNGILNRVNFRRNTIFRQSNLKIPAQTG